MKPHRPPYEPSIIVYLLALVLGVLLFVPYFVGEVLVVMFRGREERT